MRKIILASGSPRRQELLKKMGLEFDVVVSNFDEKLNDSRPVEEVAKELALGKAREVASRYPDALVIGSDTIAVLDGVQLGKQPNVMAAKQLLRELSGQIQEIYTAVALVCSETGFEDVRVAKSAIVFAVYGDYAINKYLATNDWQDKAAATAIQSPATPPVDHIQGDYDTILGLSTNLLAAMLTEQAIEATPYHPEHPYLQKRLA